MPRPHHVAGVPVRRLATVATIAALAVWLAAPAAGARPLDTGGTCLTRAGAVGRSAGHVTRDVVQLSGSDRLTRWLARHPAASSRTTAQFAAAPVTIPVAFHVIRKDTTVKGGDVPRSQITAQIAVLNGAYGGATGGADTSFQFSLSSVDRTTNAGWFKLTGTGKERKMKTALKIGGPETLNIYSADLGNSLLGWSYLAQDAKKVGVLDGVVIHFMTLPGGPWGPHYSQGDTTTHEVGHWLNLLHTFEGGCKGQGDFIDDTPAEASPAFKCPAGRDTCPAPGNDPIRNFMDYTFDSCMNRFTADQATRMQEAWIAYRAP
jgi:hypothetical protein